MSRGSEVAVEESDKESEMVLKTELHTKCVTPRRLSKELKELVGHDAQLKVEMRHNVYNIECSKPFDLDVLLANCQGLHRKKSASPHLEGVQVTPGQAVESS